MYRPPLTNVNIFLERLEVLLSQLPPNSSIVLAGDLNINFTDKTSMNTHMLINLLTSFNLSMHIDTPTRISQFSATTIDYFCSNLSKRHISCSVVAASLSDHEAIHGVLHLNIENSTCKFKLGRIFSRNNYERFYQFCQEINWECLLNLPDSFNLFHKSLVDAFHAAFPIQKIKIKNKKPWITQGIKISGKNLRSLHLIRKYTVNNYVHEYFSKYRSVYRRVIQVAKESYYKSRLAAASNKSKESWAIINNLRGKNSQAPPQFDLNLNDTNNYYCSIGKKLTENIVATNNPIDYLSNISIPTSFDLTPTNIEELKKIIKDINNKKSSGVDNLSAKIFENLPDRTLNALVCLINHSFETGVFPPSLKTSIVIPLHKGGSTDDPSNFRPISLLCTLSKIIEKLVKKRLHDFLSLHKILNINQFGFQSNKCTGDAIFGFLTEVYAKRNEAEAVAAVFCDLSKAFDCVNHVILLDKLQCYGILGTSFLWFQSYLSDRKQRVKSLEKYSDEVNISCGVPQGSVLGPILFLLYINDLASININGSFTLFADDTTILWHNKDLEILHEVICSDIHLVKKWCDANLLALNITKTNVVTFGCNLEYIPLGSNTLETRTHVKFLGLYIDNKLNFREHITNLSKKLAKGCYAIRTISNDLGYSTAKVAYFALIEAHLRYGIPFWGSCSKQLLNSVLILQKRSLRYISKARFRDPCKPLFVSHKILTVVSIFIHETVCIIHKNKNVFDSPNNHYNTRQVDNIQLPIPTSSLTKNSIIYGSRKIYNHLPVTLKNVSSLKLFRKAVKDWLIDRPYYNLQEYYNDTL